jgi:hypothetical protein
MPGPVSDSYDPEWGTRASGEEIIDALSQVYETTSKILGDQPPLYILDLLRADLPKLVTASLSEKEWRLVRFALERAKDSI